MIPLDDEALRSIIARAEDYSQFGNLADVLRAIATQALEANRMREALEKIARQMTGAEFRAYHELPEDNDGGDWEGGYDAVVGVARTALHPEPSEGEG